MTRYQFLIFKRYLEQVLMWPFVLLGRLIALLFQKPTNYDLFFFIPIYGLGGAEYVNAKILDALTHRKILVIFTRKSHEKTALHLFQHENITIRDISRWTDNKYIYWANFICRGYFALMVRRNKTHPQIFIGQCNFGYKLTPHLYRRFEVIELIHLFDKEFCNVWMPFVAFLDKRLCVAHAEIEKINQYAAKCGLPEHYGQRFKLLKLFVDIPEDRVHVPDNSGLMNVYYAGRGGAQKRLWLNVEIAREVKRLGLPVKFYYVGNFKDELPDNYMDFLTYHPPIDIGEEMYDFIENKDVLLLTSFAEGFPIVLLEAMHFGIVPVVTPVGDMNRAIQTGVNGILLDNSSEQAVVASGVEAIKSLVADSDLRKEMSAKGRAYFRANFSRESFNEFIRNVFQETGGNLVP